MRSILVTLLVVWSSGCAGCLPGDGDVISMQTHLTQYGRLTGADVLDICAFPGAEEAELVTPFEIDLGELGASGQLQLGGLRPNDLEIGAIFSNAGDKDILLQAVEVRWKVSAPVSDPFMRRDVAIEVPGKGSTRQTVPLLTSDAERQILIDTVRQIPNLEDDQIVEFQVELRFRGIDDNYFEILTFPFFFTVRVCISCGRDLGVTPMCQEAPPGWTF